MVKSYFATTDKGPYFNTNQDAYFVNLDHNVFGVIDGFGGTGIGDVISNRISTNIHNMLTKASGDQDATLKYFYDARRTVECNFIVNELLKVHDTLLIENEQKSIYQKGAACCLFLISYGNRVCLISIGKVYSLLFRNSQIQKIILEDDAPTLEKDLSALTTDGSWPKSAIGLFSPLQYQIKEVNLLPGDQILLATQGVLNKLESIEIESHLIKDSSKEALGSLMEKANRLGNRDNQTAILLRY